MANLEIQYRSDGSRRHLLTLEDMSTAELSRILDRAQAFAGGERPTRTDDATLATLFGEPSTRTRASFQIAAGRLGWQTIHIDEATSSARKGESTTDAAAALSAMGVSGLCIRHSDSRAPWHCARALKDSHTFIVNAGSGSDDHPTQGLLDALTIRQAKPDLSKLQIAICGDIKHSRVARSDIHAFTALGATDIRLVGPATLLPESAPHNCRLIDELESAIESADVIIVLRIQQERLESENAIANIEEYHQYWGLTEARLAVAKPDCLVMHPGPMNRNVEIAGDVADGPRSVILRQVTNGVFVRMAILEQLIL